MGEPVVTAAALRHVMVVGGTLEEWGAMSDRDWLDLVELLGERADRYGIGWLTLRVYGAGAAVAESARPVWRRVVGGCEVIVDPSHDGRRRFAEAMARLDPGDEVNEATVASVLYEPADSEPDLVLVLGAATQLPPSLVWELAYAELVFSPATWRQLGPAELDTAIADFSRRRRRFGGLDDE